MKLFSAENVCSCSEKHRTDEKKVETCMKVNSWNLSANLKKTFRAMSQSRIKLRISEYPSECAVP